MKENFSKMTIKEVGKTILGYFGIFLSIGVVLGAFIYWILLVSEKNYSYEIFQSKAELSYYKTKDNLVSAIDNYIKGIAETSVMNGIAFIDECDKYNVDVRFALAQCQAESAFCTKGIASKTLSAFNVLAYDGRSAGDMIKKNHNYKHPDLSIEPYLKLLTTEYMINGKTEIDLMENFVNHNGKRYASSKNYEKSILNIYNKINEDTTIGALYAEYQKYKMICGR